MGDLIGDWKGIGPTPDPCPRKRGRGVKAFSRPLPRERGRGWGPMRPEEPKAVYFFSFARNLARNSAISGAITDSQ